MLRNGFLFGLVFVMVLFGCSQKTVPPGEHAEHARCNECHNFTSSSCKNVPIMVNGMEKTQCVACHAGSIRMDSTLTDTFPPVYTYHDAVFIGSDGSVNPVNDSLHANGTINTNPSRKHCTICHDYPAPHCNINATSAINGTGMCFACHSASTQIDTSSVPVLIHRLNGLTVPTGTRRTVMDDRRFRNGANTFSETMPGHHDNGTIDFAYHSVSFGTCNSCHLYKPTSGLHALHISQNSTGELKPCISCHFNSMIYDSTLAGGFTRTGQMMFINTHGDTLPMVNPQHHLNGTVEVVFMDKVVNALPGSDTLFIWDPVGKSCSNVLCHGNGDPNSPLFKKTFWR